MAKYKFTYSCGHDGEAQLYGPEKERQRKIQYWENFGLCPECFHKKKTEEAKADAAMLGLPELSGSEKQKAWAETIRAEAAKADESRLESEFSSAFSSMLGAEQQAKVEGKISELEQNHGENAFQELKKLYLDKIRDITDCRWWIDNRAETVRRVFRELFSDWLQS